MRRKSGRLMIVSLLVLLLSICAYAAETAEPNVVPKPEILVTVSHVNPEYERLGVRFEKPAADFGIFADATVDSLAEASEYLRTQMENRVTNVEIDVNNVPYVDNAKLSEDWLTILNGAWEHTGVPTQGDYIIRHYGKAEGSIGHNGVSSATFKYTITYDTTIEQENMVGAKIDELFQEWNSECNFSNLSDYRQVKVIYDYICENVVYDYDNLEDDDYTLKYTAYAALIDGTAVCQGYANLFYRMALEAGVDTRIIVGYGGGGYHGWNIVELGDYYYYLDSTWDAGRSEYRWFLLGSDSFHTDHSPDAEFKSNAFLTEYPINTEDFDEDIHVDSNSIGAPEITVTLNSKGNPVISWADVEGAEKYEVWRAVGETGEFKLLKTMTGTKLTNTSVEANKTYYYKVRAIAGEDYSKYSQVKSVTIPPALEAPVVTVSLNSNNKPVISWAAIEGAKKYEIWRAVGQTGEFKLLKTMTGTKLTNTSVEKGVAYSYKVRAVAGDDYSEYSKIVSIEVPRVLDAPVLTVSNDAATGKIYLSWTKVDGAEKYEVWRATSEDGTYTRLLTTVYTYLTNTSTKPGVRYYYKIRAVADDLYSEYSTVKNRFCDLAQPVVTVSNNPSTGKIVISWTAVSGASNYAVYRSTSENGTYTKIITTGYTKITNTSAAPGVTYYYKVRALYAGNSNANSAYSEIKSCVCDLAQPVVTVSNNPATGKVVISWKEVSGAAKYEVYRATSENGTYTKMLTTTYAKVTNTSTEPGKTYYYKVRAIHATNSAAASAYSEIKSRTCDCARPTVTVTLNSKGKPVLTWKAVAGAVKYEVYRSTSENGEYTPLWTGTITKLTNSSAKSGVTYYYKVIAICSVSAGNSAYSAVQAITAE